MLQVGAGPTALTLALTLAQYGVAIRVIEKLDVLPNAQRGTGSQVLYTLAIVFVSSLLNEQCRA